MTDTKQETTIGPTRAEIRKAIFADVLSKYAIEEPELFSDNRDPDLVQARREIAFRLRKAGFETSHIARALHRDRSTIHYYFDSLEQENSKDRSRLSSRARVLPEEVRRVIEEFARLKNVPPWRILSEWITERASYEIDRARAERAA